MSSNPSLYEYLRQNDFLVDKSIAVLVEAVIRNSKRKALLLRGPAGVGKTQLTYMIAKFLSAEYIFYQCTYGSSEDDLLYKYIPSEDSKSGIRITLGPIPRALAMSKNKNVVLVLDEFDKTRPSADALLLDVLQNFRVSLYIDEKETIITANPENLIIFLTSNDMREFSEPLLRRVVTITLKPLTPEAVFEILSKKFRKEIALLLTQIYADTINAGLRKPATIQELYQLGEVLEAGVSISLEELLKMFIVKYDDDWKKYREYIASRKAYEIVFGKEKGKEQKSEEENISRYYEPGETEIEIKKEDNNKNINSVTSLLEKLRKFTVRFVETKAEPIRIEEDKDVEVTLKLPDNDFNAYTYVIKTLRPEPTDNPSKLGKFEYVEGEMSAIISREPLTVEEAYQLSMLSEVEGYYDDILLIKDESIEKIINSAKKIKYYTKNKIYLETYSGSTSDEDEEEKNDYEEKLVIERVGDISVRVKGYFKKNSGSEKATPMLEILKNILNHNTVSYLVNLLSKPRNSVYINLRNIGGDIYCDDNIAVDNIINIIENLRRSNIKNNVKFSVGERNYNFYVDYDGNELVLGIGYRYKDAAIKNVSEVKEKQRYSIDDEIVDRIVEALKTIG